jgi:hypothetical protein
MRISVLMTVAIITGLLVDSTKTAGCCQLKSHTNTPKCEITENHDNAKCTNDENNFKETECIVHQNKESSCIPTSVYNDYFNKGIFNFAMSLTKEKKEALIRI